MGRREFVELLGVAATTIWPRASPAQQSSDDGGLIAYGPSVAENFRRAADYVDRILKGSKPAELSMEEPTRYELTINLSAAKALGLTIPPSVLVRADKVIK